jgi:hypothetical protein
MQCQEQRLTRRKGTNHVLHLVLTLVTLGVWGIVWAIVALTNRSKSARCSVCGAVAAPLSWRPEALATGSSPSHSPM